MDDSIQWSVWLISDAEEPEDHVLAGMRHRDFDGVLLCLLPDGNPDDTEAFDQKDPAGERVTRPLLLFYRGSAPSDADVMQLMVGIGNEVQTNWFAFPDSFDDYGAPWAECIVEIPCEYPHNLWVEEAKLGMEMGYYFSEVELTDWSDATVDHPGVYHYRFSMSTK